MSALGNRSQSSARRGDYIWQYEYYDYDEPVSFEGLRAHRYSIVIGFWVGLAVFVIFMFFVLALLSKTRAPRQENPESADKHHRPDGYPVDIDSLQDENAPSFTHPLLSVSRAYSHFCIQNSQDSGKKTSEDSRFGEQNLVPQVSCHHLGGGSSPRRDTVEVDLEGVVSKQPLHGRAGDVTAEDDYVFFTQFNIPNFVSLEQSSELGEEELLYEPSAVLERREAHCDIH
ncbi:hypothetical protein fugu_017630 [Takifugu bimaculatus]|uniref:Melanocortin-2 receptor accessory protein 2A n=1 Tax=Takifugu bimaculatus TaxID=433685 RepID=A0A4Z2BRH1_9TELE|nr:hypothetical protein fugu_017630 [Takifugu bimaculatus]